MCTMKRFDEPITNDSSNYHALVEQCLKSQNSGANMYKTTLSKKSTPQEKDVANHVFPSFIPGGSTGERANFTWLVLGWIEPDL